MTGPFATGVGSFPGTEQRDFDEALAIVRGELADDEHGIAFVPEVPGRATHAAMVGRTLGLLGELDADLQPDGWRLTGTSGAAPLDQRRARSLLGQDLDTVEDQLHGHRGPFKVQVTGPWTLAATVEKPRGDKLLADHGARRELAQALAHAVGEHLSDVRRRLPEASRLIVQLDEPALNAVLAARIPTASGFGKHRAIHPPEASEALGWVTEAVEAAGGEAWVHSCAADVPIGLLRGAGARGVLLDLALLTADGMDAAAEALEAGATIGFGIDATTERAMAERIVRWLDAVGLDPVELAGQVVLTSPCGLAGADAGAARRTVEVGRRAARALLEIAAG